VSDNKYGTLLRVYTPKPEEVSGRVDRAVGYARQVAKIRGIIPQVGKLIFLVPSEHDCGQTADALRARLFGEDAQETIVLETSGHHSCETLNEGVAESERLGVTHAIIVSGKAMGYFTPEILRSVDDMFGTVKLHVVGVATDELRDIVLAGRVQNTFAVWDIDALNEVGGFDAKNGVEEIAPLVRLCQLGKHRRIGVISPPGGTLDIADSETARARHAEVMKTKIARQYDECQRLGRQGRVRVPGRPHRDQGLVMGYLFEMLESPGIPGLFVFLKKS
jgi:hypothetical protein